ncbi:MAG: tRNA lysidine(34) synthetase TilS [Gammaproteobacteria bacterium]|nr:tRNA lysidine(34) synthetase TilS [Gammaproteobacteria bacterium]
MKTDDPVAGLLPDLRRHLPEHGRLCVAYSGGIDSHVLLHFLVGKAHELGQSIVVGHINHGLHAQADAWEQHCRDVCAAFGVPIVVARIDQRPQAGLSLEAWARQQRYRLLRRLLGEDAVLVTAHHARDQAETFLLRALRGASTAGLAGISASVRIEGLHVVRPMLHVAKAAIDAYAARHGLVAVEDPSNEDLNHDRNFIRHVVMPLVRERWPAVDAVWSRNAGLLRQDADLLHRLTAEVLEHALRGPQLDLSRMAGLRADLREAVMRLWLRRSGLTPPTRQQLEQLLRQAFDAATDRNPVIRLGSHEVRRFRQCLYLLPPLPERGRTFRAKWNPETPLPLPWGLLHAEPAVGTGLAVDRITGATIEVRLRRGGEHFRIRCAGPRRRLKLILQELDVPPWERSLLPLLFVNGELAAIADYLIVEEYRAAATAPGLQLIWERKR